MEPISFIENHKEHEKPSIFHWGFTQEGRNGTLLVVFRCDKAYLSNYKNSMRRPVQLLTGTHSGSRAPFEFDRIDWLLNQFRMLLWIRKGKFLVSHYLV